MSDDSSASPLSGEKDLAEEITAAVDDIGRLLKPAFSLMTDELESLEIREAELVVYSRRIMDDSIRHHKDSMLDSMDSSILKLNVGGKDINVRKSSILSRTSPGSLFGILASGRWDSRLTKDQHGRVFLDVDPEWIEVIINVLRDTGRIALPSVAPEKDSGFRAVLAYYNLTSLFSDLTIDLSEESEIKLMNVPYNREVLHSFLRPELAEEKPRRLPLKLLYRFPRDGTQPADQHSRCQGNGSTLTVIEDVNGAVLGCYAEGKWDLSSPVAEGDGKKSFFFSLTTKTPKKYDLYAKSPFTPAMDPANVILYFGTSFAMNTVRNAFCGVWRCVKCSMCSIGKSIKSEGFKPIKIEVYQIECLTTPVGSDLTTAAPASTSGNTTQNPSDMSVEADGRETERLSKSTVASLIMADKITDYNKTFVARLRAMSESVFKAERELLMELLLVRQLTSTASRRHITAGLQASWESTVADISAIDSATCGNKQSDMIKELLLELNIAGAEAEAVAVAVTVNPKKSKKRSFSETQAVEESEEVMSFNVGGTIIAVLKSTLMRQAPDSVFASRVSDRWRKSAGETVDGHVCLVSK